MTKLGLWLTFFPAVLLVCGCSAAQQELTYIDLIERLTDLEYPASLPAAEEVCKQWSSYDRSSYYDETTGKYVNWEANGDGFGGNGWIRKEGDQLVLAEMEGPGCIWRIWSATPRDGHVRIYLDGASEPAVDLPFIGYFDGTNEPFNRSALVNIVASGKNNYVPIPFQRSCKIIADEDYGEFHHFNYTLFPKNTKVPTFKRKLSVAESAVLDKANEKLSNCGPHWAKYPKERTETIKVKIKPGQNKIITKIKGPNAITSLIAKPKLPEDVEEQRQMLRELVIKIFWDSEKQPSVWTPLGDFFGTAPGVNYYRSMPLGMTEESLYSNWYMPFAKEAQLVLVNDGDKEYEVEFEITNAPLLRDADSYGRFHAKWHRDKFLPTEEERWIDWTLLKTQGKGRFCGVQLQIWNPLGAWWGEGDEKFFVDAEKFPSTYGTGSEDYFGYAWSDPMLFENCYHNQPISEDNKGHISVNRWHIVDNIPFQKSFEGCIEKYFPNERPTLYTCIVFWYLEKEGLDPYQAEPLSNRIGYYAEPTFPLDLAGISVLEKPLGSIETQHMGSFGSDKWRDDRQLWWTGEEGASLKIGLTVEKEGDYKILTRLTKAVDYGIFQFFLDGEQFSDPMDLFEPDTVICTDQLEFGPFHLTEGEHVIEVKNVGINEKAVKRYMFGMDYLDLEAVSK